jgi:acyl-coenzyme A thioesterase PaaI-like protein
METWPKIEINQSGSYDMCFGCGKGNPAGLKLKFAWDEKTKTASADFFAAEHLQGWSGYLHGGITSCVLDEAMGWAALLAGSYCITARMQIRFRRMAPIGQKYLLSCRVTKQNARLIETEAVMTDLSGNIFAEGKGTQFVVKSGEGRKKDD